MIFYKLFRRSYQFIVLLFAIVTAVFLSIAGHYGAKLTHVAGVGPMGKYLMKEHGSSHNEKDMEGMDMKGDSTMEMNDSMPGMKNMPGMDTMKNMDMNNMPGMDKMKDMKDMKGMADMKNMKGMDNMKDMDMKDMKNMDKMNDMKDMPGMDTMKNMKGMDNMKDMKDMPGMDSSMKMGDMKNMSMPMTSPMDTFRFPDNNPARKKTKNPNKQ